MKNGIRAFLAGVFVCLYLFLFLSNVVFYHTHYLPDGEVVKHSHPFKSPKHSHSDAEFHFLPIGAFSVIEPLSVTVQDAVIAISRISWPDQPQYKESVVLSLSVRGPPAFV